MLYLAQVLLPWLLASLLLGLGVGWWSCRQSPTQTGLAAPGAALAALAIGLTVAAAALVPGRMGLWLDTGLLFIGWYLAGCCLGWMLGRIGTSPAEPVAASAGPQAEPAPMPQSTRAAPVAAAPVTTTSFQWQATKEGDILTLSGSVVSEEVRSRISAAAKQVLPRVTVKDLMQLAVDAPQRHESMAAAAFGHLAGLERGVASLIGGRYALIGAAKSGTDREALAAAARSLPAGFTLVRVDLVESTGEASETVETELPGAKPPTLAGPRGGKADDLKRIRGIGRQNERKLNAFGVWHFDQIAAWEPDQALWLGTYLAFPGRIEREDWIAQARLLAAGEETEFSKRVAKGLVATSQADAEPAAGDAVTKPGGDSFKGSRADRKPKA